MGSGPRPRGKKWVNADGTPTERANQNSRSKRKMGVKAKTRRSTRAASQGRR